MAIERAIPKDISKYEAKLIGPLTTRNVVFGIPGFALGVGCYFLLRPFVSNDVNFFIDIAVALPFLLCGWYKPYGIPFEKYISIVFVSQVLAPKHRKYRTENTYSCLKKAEEKKDSGKKKNRKKEKKEFSGDLARYE